MDIRRNDIDSRILGGTVLECANVAADDDLASIEAAYVAEHDPMYVVCKVPIEDVSAVHRLEAIGFRFIEAQLRLTFSWRTPFEVPKGYRFERVTSEEELEQVLPIVRETFTDDRWLVDPALAHARALSAARYEAYVRQSLAREDERVYRLVAEDSGRTLAMKTHRILPDGTALMLLGGVHPDYKSAGLAPIAAYCEFNTLLSEGVKRLTTHVSARNTAIVNLELRAFQYRLAQTFAVLRKLYRQP